jgi:hypothetical protein
MIVVDIKIRMTLIEAFFNSDNIREISVVENVWMKKEFTPIQFILVGSFGSREIVRAAESQKVGGRHVYLLLANSAVDKQQIVPVTQLVVPLGHVSH